MSILKKRMSYALALMSFLAFSTTLQADITVKTFLDANNNGIQDEDEDLITGLSVAAYDVNGNEVPLLDDGQGTFTLPSELMIGQVRLQVTGYGGSLMQGAAGPTSVFFGEDGDSFLVPVSAGPTVTPGSSAIMIPCYDGGPADGKDTPGFVSFPYESEGVAAKFGGSAPDPRVDATVGEIGSTWGVAYQSSKNRVFTSTLLKRHVGLGPEDVGGLYMLDYNDIAPDGDPREGKPALTSMNFQGMTGADGEVISFETIRRESTDGDVDETMPYTLTTRLNTATYDMDAFIAVGKTSFGDIDLTEDQQELWMVNLSQRSLISMDVSGDDLGQNVRSHDIMSQSGLPNLNFRYRMCINAGGNRNGSGAEPFTDAHGVAWDKNKYSEGGQSAFNTGTFANTLNTEMQTSGDMLYQTYRMGDFSYNIAAPTAETYTVILHFAEPNVNFDPSDRLFNVKAEGETKLANYDIVSEAGGTRRAVTATFEVEVTDGKLNLEFESVQGATTKQALVSGVEVIGQSVMKSGVLRPWGLGFNGDRGYLGMVADASISKSREHLMAYVLSFDPDNFGAGFTEELAFELGYPRERASNAHLNTPQPLRSGEWQAWVDDWEGTAINTQNETLSSTGALLTAYPQPILSDIDFEVDGSMVIGLMDRYAHQTGYRNYPPVLDDQTLIVSYGAGDLLKVVQEDGVMQLEVGHDDDGPFRDDDGPSFDGEFFHDDHFVAASAHHGEIFTGGLAILPTSGMVVNTVFNPVKVSGNANFRFDGIYTQGIQTYNLETGNKERGYLFVEQFTQGKANGLGDIEFFFQLAGGEVGNRVFCDVNGNGIQDPGENGINGIEVELVNKDDGSLRTTTTAMDGNYLFDDLELNTCYYIRVNLQQLEDLGYSGMISPDSMGMDSMVDSDGTLDPFPNYSSACYCTCAEPAAFDHSVDFGFIGPERDDVSKLVCVDAGNATIDCDFLIECIQPNNNIVSIHPDSADAHNNLNGILLDDACTFGFSITGGETRCFWARIMIDGDEDCFSLAEVCFEGIDATGETELVVERCPDEGPFDLATFMADNGYTNPVPYTDADKTMSTMSPIDIVSYPDTVWVDADLEGGAGCDICVMVIFNELAVASVDAGMDTDVCEDFCINMLDLGATFDPGMTGITEATWTTNGDGTFTPDNTFGGALMYCPGEMDLANSAPIELILSIDGGDMCSIDSDTAEVRFLEDVPIAIEENTDSVLCIDPFAIDPTIENDSFPGCRLLVNCSTDTLSGKVIDYSIIDVGPCDEVVKKIKRTFEFEHEKETYTCCDTIVVLPLPDSIICPPMMDSVYCNDNFKKDANGNPHPDETGVPFTIYEGDTIPLWPQPNSLCRILIDYKDWVFDASCPETLKREWYIKNTCAGVDTICTQWLMIFDTIGPELKKDFTGFVVDTLSDDTPVVLLPASTHSCDAHAYIPPIMVTDPCSDVKTVKVIVPDYTTVLFEYNALSGLWESHEQIKLPKSEEPIPFIYHAYDACHNITPDTCYFYIKDYVKPVAICDKGINVTVNNDETVWVYASSMDEGSWDNCGIGYTLARRTDWATACGVDLCDDIEFLCEGKHYDSLWCATLEMDKSVNEIEAHYAKAIKWLCEDGNPCASALLSGWAYDLIQHTTLNCVDHPYEVTEKDVEKILQECIIQLGDGTYLPADADAALAQLLCEKYGDGFNPTEEALFKPAAGSKLSFLDIGKQLGGRWSDAVPFCCEDACTNVTVELLTMDYWCNWSKCWTDVWVEDNTPPVVVKDLNDVHITCASYKGYYADAVDAALAGDYDAIQEKLGFYDKVTIDEHGNPSDKTTYRLYEINCTTSVQTKDTLIYDEHLGYEWETIEYERAEYDTVYDDFHNGAVADDCGLQCIEMTPWVSLDHCGNGYVKRVFKFVGQCQIEGNEHKSDTVTRHQTIWITSDCPISKAMFDVPEDLVVNTCGLEYNEDGSGNLTGALDPSMTGEASYLFDNDCRLVGIGHYDKVFRIVGGDNACYKILRTWCFADWCAMGLEEPVDGSWWLDDNYVGKYLSCTQKIIVEDLSPPICTIDAVGDNGVVETSGCVYTLDVDVSVEDECGLIEYQWQVKDVTDGGSTVVETGDGDLNSEMTDGFNVTVADLPPGDYKLVVLVRDDCQNEGQCERPFEIVARKGPAPICITTLTAELTPMDTTGDGMVDFAMAEVWANEFNSSSAPACGGTIVDYRIDNGEGNPALPDSNSRSLVVTCEDLPEKLVRMYVLDDNGNWDFCEVILVIQDNNNVCGDPSSTTGTISGNILTETSRPVEHVKVQATNTLGGMVGQLLSTLGGQYALNLTGTSQASVKLEKNTGFANGVSTHDMVAIQKHILGKQHVSSWYQEQAADVNNDGRISPIDLIELRKLILGKTTEFENNTSWRFFEKSSKDEIFEIAEIKNGLKADFVGVKIGDVNLDSDPSRRAARSARTLTLVTQEVALKAGQVTRVVIESPSLEEVEGFQFTLEVDPNLVQITNVAIGDEGVLSPENIYHGSDNASWLTTSWNEVRSTIRTEKAASLTLDLVATEAVVLSDVLAVTGKHTAAEAYHVDGSEMSVAISFETEADSEFALEQNTPNPFSNETMISFSLPEAMPATLTVYDVAGKTVRAMNIEGVKGLNRVEFDRPDLTEGILYYKLQTTDETAVKKMILID